MKVILYSNNNFQSQLCLEAISAYLKQSDPKPSQTFFDGSITLKTNQRSVTAIYKYGKDNIINFTKPVKEEDKRQLKLKL